MTSRNEWSGGPDAFDQVGGGGDAEVYGRPDSGVIPVVGPPPPDNRLPIRPGHGTHASLGGVSTDDSTGDTPTLQAGARSPDLGTSDAFRSGGVFASGVAVTAAEFSLGNAYRIRIEGKLGTGFTEFQGHYQGDRDYVATGGELPCSYQQTVTVFPVAAANASLPATCRHSILSDVTAMWYGAGQHSLDVQEAALHVTLVPEEQTALMQQYASSDGRAEYLRYHSGELTSDVMMGVAASKFKYRYCDGEFRRRYRNWLHARLGISCSFSVSFGDFSEYRTVRFKQSSPDVSSEPNVQKVYCNDCGFLVRAAGHAARCQRLVSATPVAKTLRWVRDAVHTCDIRQIVSSLHIPFSEMDMMAQRFCNRDAQAKYLKGLEPSALPLYASSHAWADAFEERYEGAFRDTYLEYVRGVLKQ